MPGGLGVYCNAGQWNFHLCQHQKAPGQSLRVFCVFSSLALSLSSLSLDTCSFVPLALQSLVTETRPLSFSFSRGKRSSTPALHAAAPPPPHMFWGSLSESEGLQRQIHRYSSHAETGNVHHPLSFALSGFPLSHCDSLVCCRPVQVQFSLVPRIRAPGPLTVQEGTLAVLPLSLLLLLLLLGQGHLCTRPTGFCLERTSRGKRFVHVRNWSH